jgi:hypothetical protein
LATVDVVRFARQVAGVGSAGAFVVSICRPLFARSATNSSLGRVLVKRHLWAAALTLTLAIHFLVAAAWVDAATITSYVASGDPGAAPDANAQSIDAWTTTLSATGGRGSGFFSPFTLSPTPWVLFSFPSGGVNGSIQADHAFEGGPLGVGQAVLIDWANRAIDAGSSVGVSLTSGGTAAVTFKFVGGDPDGVYRYDDAGGTGQSTGAPFAYQSMNTLKFALTGATTYTASYGASTWSGTYSGAIDGIRVFNNGGGNGSDVPFNNLSVVPEPASFVLVVFSAICALVAIAGDVHRRN